MSDARQTNFSDQVKTGRPSKFTPKVRASILADVAASIPMEMAAKAAGITETTLYAWLRQADEDMANDIDSEFAHFSQDLQKVIIGKIKYNVAVIEGEVEGKEKTWGAHAWMLERHPRSRKQFSSNGDALERIEQKIADLEAKLTEAK